MGNGELKVENCQSRLGHAISQKITINIHLFYVVIADTLFADQDIHGLEFRRKSGLKGKRNDAHLPAMIRFRTPLNWHSTPV